MRSPSRYAVAQVVTPPSRTVIPIMTASAPEKNALTNANSAAAVSHSVMFATSWRSGPRSVLRCSRSVGARSSTSQRRAVRNSARPQTVPIATATTM